METDTVDHQMNMYEEENGGLTEIPIDTVGILNVGVTGKRWEGGILDNQPYGYGTLFNDEGERVYEGTMVDGQKFGYGAEYYGRDVKIYEGSFVIDQKHGFGRFYDRNGLIEYEGQYVLGKPLQNTESFIIHNHRKTLSIPDDMNTGLSSLILLSWLQDIQTITIGNHCLSKVRRLEIRGMKRLERLTIGSDSFTQSQKRESKERPDGLCCIVHCGRLRCIDIGHRSCGDFHTLQLEDLPMLETLQFGENCFEHAPLFSLNGTTNRESRPDLPHLHSILFHEWAFRYCHTAILSSGEASRLEW